MLRKGWDESKGLGPSGEGRRIPIKTILKHDRKGFGKKSSNVARVSHFDARDPNSVQYKQPRFKKGINKKKTGFNSETGEDQRTTPKEMLRLQLKFPKKRKTKKEKKKRVTTIEMVNC